MFGLGPSELLIILVILILVFGGKRVAEVGRGLGESVKALKEGYRSGMDRPKSSPPTVDADYVTRDDDQQPSGS